MNFGRQGVELLGGVRAVLGGRAAFLGHLGNALDLLGMLFIAEACSLIAVVISATMSMVCRLPSPI